MVVPSHYPQGEADDSVFNVNGGLYSLPLGEG